MPRTVRKSPARKSPKRKSPKRKSSKRKSPVRKSPARSPVRSKSPARSPVKKRRSRAKAAAVISSARRRSIVKSLIRLATVEQMAGGPLFPGGCMKTKAPLVRKAANARGINTRAPTKLDLCMQLDDTVKPPKRRKSRV